MGIIVANGSRPTTLPSDGNAGSRTDGLRVMTLNVGGGYENDLYNSAGMDPGDVDELARRIANQDVDVATLQEVWQMDLPELERQLEQITGDEWDLHFAQASTKVRADDDNWGTLHLDQPFGNVIAVRLGDGVARSELVGRQKLDAPGDDGSDGRVAISVRVFTDDGASVDIATAHTDYDGVGDEARAQQIEDLRTFAENGADGGPVIITGDLNDTIGDDDPSSRALRDYVEEHGYTDAGDIGATSDFGDGRRIDFIFASSGIGTGDPERVEGHSPDEAGEDRDLSDHDGIVVDVDIPIAESRVGSGGAGGGGGSW
jgi:endonuclease/exonuclease/phosphatase family metal-dependent hydrolase